MTRPMLQRLHTQQQLPQQPRPQQPWIGPQVAVRVSSPVESGRYRVETACLVWYAGESTTSAYASQWFHECPAAAAPAPAADPAAREGGAASPTR
jgi:hypothetical protein